jgi:hypothetical protein
MIGGCRDGFAVRNEKVRYADFTDIEMMCPSLHGCIVHPYHIIVLLMVEGGEVVKFMFLF